MTENKLTEMNFFEFCHTYMIVGVTLCKRICTRGLVMNFYPRPSSYRKHLGGTTYWQYCRFQMIKFCPWDMQIESIIADNDEILPEFATNKDVCYLSYILYV